MFLINQSYEQTKVAKYCEVTTFVGGFAGKLHVELITGKVDSLLLLEDAATKSQLQKVTTMKTAPDILNYMSTMGWLLVSVTTISPYKKTNYYFVKEFATTNVNNK